MTDDTKVSDGSWATLESRCMMLVDPDQQCVGTIEIRVKKCGVLWDGRYWGVWQEEHGWLLDCDGMMFYTASKEHAQAQMEVTRSLEWFESVGADGWHVREIGGQDDG